MKIRCPNCQFGIQFADQIDPESDATHKDIVCPSCNSRIDFSSDPTESLFPNTGESIEHFEIREHLGEGAFGVVYAAYDTKLERMVAIKAAREGKASSKRMQAMMKEARAASTISHPGIIQVYEFGVHEERPYLVTEFVDGITLGDWLKEERSFDVLAKMMHGICEAVEAAHREKVVHRDLKPGNVLVDKLGAPHVGDFGLARRESASDATIAASGTVLGTVAYMSPEQASGRPELVNASSDIYSLGVCLYQMLTGKRPFSASESRTLLYKIQYEDPENPNKLRKDIPRDLSTICMHAMEKEPSRRYVSAQEFADDLTRYLNGESIKARPVGRLEHAARWMKRNRMLASSICASVLLAVFAGWMLLSGGGEGEKKVRVAIECELPSDASGPETEVDWVFARMDDNRLVDPEQVQQFIAHGSSVDTRLAPGEYLVVAKVDGVGFHEVYRLVPEDLTAMPGSFNPSKFQVDGNIVRLPPVKILPAEETVRPLVLVKGGPIKRGKAGNEFNPETDFQVADFYIGRNEVSFDEFTKVIQQPAVYSGSEPPPTGDYPIVGVHFYAAAHYAEQMGCRLPTEVELEFVATNGGTTQTPWGTPWLPDPRWSLKPITDETLDETPTTKIRGLFSNAAEITSTPLRPMGDGAMPASSIPVAIDSYIYKGGPFRQQDAAQGVTVNLTDRRCLESRQMSGDFLSFRCVRSAMPLDLVRLAEIERRARYR